MFASIALRRLRPLTGLALAFGLSPLLAACGSVSLAATEPAPLSSTLTDPAPAPTRRTLRELGTYKEADWQPRHDFAVAGGRVYVADTEAGIHVLDVSDPRAPRKLATVMTDHRFVEIVAEGNRLYGRASVENQGVDVFTLLIVDVTDTQQPQVLGRMTIQDVREMVVEGDYLYFDTFGSATGAQIVVVDVRDPAAPVTVGHYPPEVKGERILELQVAQGVAYFLTHEPGVSPTRLDAVDLTSPQAPRRLGSYPAPTMDRLRLDTGFAILGGEGLELVDIRDPGALRHVATYEVPWLGDFSVADGVAYVVDFDATVQPLDFSGGQGFVALAPMAMWQARRATIVASRALGGRAYFLVEGFEEGDDGGLSIAALQLAPGCPAVPEAVRSSAEHVAPRAGAAQSPPAHVELSPLALWGGAGSPVAVLADGIVFEGEGMRLYSRQLNGSAAPTTLGSIELDGVVRGLAVADGVAWVTTGSSSLWAVDVRDPRQVRLLGRAEGLDRAAQVVVDGGRVYVVEGSALSVLDGRDPRQPKRLGRLSDEDNITRIAVWGSHVYAHSESSTGLSVVDVANPAQPRRVARLAERRRVTRIAVSDQRLYMVVNGPPTLYIRDLSNPTAPEELAALSLGEIDAVGGLVARGELLVVADTPMWVISVRDPRLPVVLARFDHPSTVASLTLDGERLLLVDEPDDLLSGIGVASHVLDLSDPTIPRLAASWRPAGVVADVAVAGNTAYVNHPEGLRALDVTNPAAPGALGEVGGLLALQDLGRVLVDGSHGVRTADWRLSVLDVADPGHIHEVSALRRVFGPNDDPYEDTRVRDVAGGQGRLYVAVADFGLAVVDLTDPSFPSPLGQLSRREIAHVAHDGDRAALVDQSTDGWRLTLVDVANPCALQPLGEYITRIYEPQVALAGDTAYVWGRTERAGTALQVIDLSNPAAPRLASTLQVPVTDLAVAEGLTWLAGANLLTALDVADPDHPRSVARMILPGAPSALAVVGDAVYVALGERGLLTLRQRPTALRPTYLPAVQR